MTRTFKTFILLCLLLLGLTGSVSAASLSVTSASLNTAGTAIAVSIGGVSGSLSPASAITGFTVTAGGVSLYTTAVTSSGSTVTLTLGLPQPASATLTLAYTPGNLTDTGADTLPATSGNAVTNGSSVAAVTWSQLFTDNFVRANTIAGFPYSTTGAGNGWRDLFGGAASIQSNAMQISGSLSQLGQATPVQYAMQAIWVMRPPSESGINQKLTTVTAAGAGTGGFVCVLRQLSENSAYVIWRQGSSYTLWQTGRYAAATSIGGQYSPSYTEVAAHQYQIDVTCTGTAPVIVTLSVTDLSTSAQVFTCSWSDSAARITQLGRMGLGNYGGVPNISSFTDYSGDSAAVLTTGNVTCEQADTAGITMGVTATGGIPPYTYAWQRNTVPNLAVGAGGTVALSGSNSAVFKDTTATAGTTYFYKCRVTDSAGTPAASLSPFGAAAMPSLSPLVIGYMGDSVTAQGQPYYVTTGLRTLLYPRVVNAVNTGQGGTSLANWLVGGANYTNMLSTFTANGVNWVFVMFGLNDLNSAASTTTVNSFVSNMSTVATDLANRGYHVVILRPSLATVGNYNPLWSEGAAANLLSAQSALASLDNGSTIFVRGAAHFPWTAQNPQRLLDGTHPDEEGRRAFGFMDAHNLYDTVFGGVSATLGTKRRIQ